MTNKKSWQRRYLMMTKPGYRRAGSTRLELATSGLTGKSPKFYTPVTPNI